MNISILARTEALLKGMPKPLVAVALFLTLSAGLVLVFVLENQYDHRAQVAEALLYEPPMKRSQYEMRDNPALTGALNGKFPPGSSADALFAFVSSLKGYCVEPRVKATSANTHVCSIPLEGELFSSIDIRIQANVEAGKLTALEVKQTHELY